MELLSYAFVVIVACALVAVGVLFGKRNPKVADELDAGYKEIGKKAVDKLQELRKKKGEDS